MAARPPLADGAFARLAGAHWSAGIEISAETGGPGWDGEVVDYDACVAALT